MMKRILVALLLCSFLSMPALAGPMGWVDMKYLGAEGTPHKKATLYADADGVYDDIALTGYEVARSDGVDAGYYKHAICAASGLGSSVPDPLFGFCIDVLQNPADECARFDVVDLTAAPDPTLIGATMTVAKADLLRELWGRHYSTALTDQQAAEFQLAVWEIVFETSGTYDIGTGSLLSTDFNAGTNALLSSLDGTGPKARLVALTSPDYQDILTTVPAPGALLLGALGTGLVGWIRRRRSL